MGYFNFFFEKSLYDMGGGNGQKSAAARARNQLKAAKKKNKKSNLESLKNQPMIKCKRCLQTFSATTQQSELERHCENKHKAYGFKTSFPTFGKVIPAPKAASGFKPDKEKKVKKKSSREECRRVFSSLRYWGITPFIHGVGLDTYK